MRVSLISPALSLSLLLLPPPPLYIAVRLGVVFLAIYFCYRNFPPQVLLVQNFFSFPFSTEVRGYATPNQRQLQQAQQMLICDHMRYICTSCLEPRAVLHRWLDQRWCVEFSLSAESNFRSSQAGVFVFLFHSEGGLWRIKQQQQQQPAAAPKIAEGSSEHTHTHTQMHTQNINNALPGICMMQVLYEHT